MTALTEVSGWRAFTADPDRAIDELCELMADGGSLVGCARQLGVSYFRLWEWIHETPERAGRYARAQEARAVLHADAVQSIHEEPVRRNFRGDLDPADVALKRLKADNLKWAAAKLAPKRYGDKLEVDATVKHDVVGELREAIKSRSRLPVKPVDVIEARE